MRLSTLTAFFALCAAGYFVYQAQQAGALVAIPPQEKPAEATPEKPAEPTTAKTNFPTFTCTPDGFTLTLNEDGYRLHGTLETPTPGYNYTPLRIDETTNGADMVFQLNAPSGMVAQVISKMEIDHMYVRDVDMSEMRVRLDKTFNWGPDTITCTKVATAEETKAEEPAPAAEETPAKDPVEKPKEQEEQHD